MELTSWLQIALICFLGAITPGPSLALVVSNSISKGKLYGVITGISHAFGICIWAVLTVIGISTIILESKSAMIISQVVGGLLILYVGYRTYITEPDKSPQQVANQGGTHKNLPRAGFEGFMISLLNPKIALFFLAIFSHFVSQNSSWLEICLMGLTAGIIDGIWYTCVAIAVGNAKAIPLIQKKSSGILKVSGILMTLIAIYLLITALIKII